MVGKETETFDCAFCGTDCNPADYKVTADIRVVCAACEGKRARPRFRVVNGSPQLHDRRAR